MFAAKLSRRFARAMLLWLGLYLVAGVASPLVSPQSIEQVCSASGSMRLVLLDDDGQEVVSAASLDCPLCASFAAPPPAAQPPARQPVRGVASSDSPSSPAGAAPSASLPPARAPPAIA
jgi:hypothetical protein